MSTRQIPGQSGLPRKKPSLKHTDKETNKRLDQIKLEQKPEILMLAALARPEPRTQGLIFRDRY